MPVRQTDSVRRIRPGKGGFSVSWVPKTKRPPPPQRQDKAAPPRPCISPCVWHHPPVISGALFAEVSPDFFRVLTGANARIYIDAVDALSREMGEGALGVSRQE